MYAATLLVISLSGSPSLDVAVARASQHTQAWADCLSANARKYSTTGEAIELVVSASFGACADEERGVRLTLVPVFGLAHISSGGLSGAVGAAELAADNEILTMRARYREEMIRLLLETKVKPQPEK